MRDFILLFVNGQQHRVTGADAFKTLSDYLRGSLKLCGTKIVCSEGDCGSCSVLCGRLIDSANNHSDQIKYVPIDSCIRFVFQLDGCHIITVEGLGCENNLNGVQQAMVDCHGSQCGFCTPGFVVTMTGMLEESDQLDEQQLRNGLTGNLCRCTGYSPIIEAGKRSNCSNTERMNERFPLGQLQAFDSSKTIADEFSDFSNDEIVIKAELVPGSLNAGELNSENPDTAKLDAEIQSVFCPIDLPSALKFFADQPYAKVVSGATDIGVQFNKGNCPSSTFLDLNRVSELAGISIQGETIVAGARATWTEFEHLTRELVPAFYEIVSRFGSPQIRNVGTIGGNIINASPIADSLPFLFVCDAKLELASAKGVRTVNINDFYHGYKKFDLQPGELLTRLIIPLPSPTSQLRLYKVSRRRDLDISTFTGAIMMELDRGEISTAKLAYGAVGPVVLRLPKTEAFLIGKPFEIQTMKAAGDIAVEEITPISDVRGGSDFRLQLARNVLQKFFHEVQLEGAAV